MNTIDEKTKNILREFQNNFKLETKPFKRIANDTNCSEEEVITTIGHCIDKGLIRRIGVAVKPQKAGLSANALTAWKVSPERIHEIGSELAEMKEVSHCYDRECPEGWDYNLFVMLHSKTKEDLEKLIKSISETYDLKEYKVYNTVRELKKSSMKYF